MCTRAAYADEFLATVEHQPLPPGVELDRSGDGLSIVTTPDANDGGIALDAADLGERLAGYLSRTEPLGACRYCFGGDGVVEPHHQLSRAEIAAGKLSRQLTVVRG